MKVLVKARDGITVPAPAGVIGQKAVPVELTPFIRARLAETDLELVPDVPAPDENETAQADAANADLKPGPKKK